MILDRLDWKPLIPDQARRRAALLLYDRDESPLLPVQITGEEARLPFYAETRLIRLRMETDEFSLPLFLLQVSDDLLPFDGSGRPLHTVADRGDLALTSDTVADYLRFYCFFVRGGEGAFLVVDPPAESPSESDAGASAVPDEYAGLVEPLHQDGSDEEESYLLEATVHYGPKLSRCRFRVLPRGTVVMMDDQTVHPNVPRGTFAEVPPLYTLDQVRQRIERFSTGPLPAPTILRILVELLMEEALGAASSSRLLRHFNNQTPGLSPLDRFATFVTSASPVVAIESRLPFIEDSVADLVQARAVDQGRGSLRILRPQVDGGDDNRLRFIRPIEGSGVVLFPFHAYRSVADVERVAHNLAAHGMAGLIGCARLEDVPVPIRQVVDLRLQLPALSPDLFATLFERVTGHPLADGWDADGAHWVGHVHHSDFQHPQGLDLGPEAALDYVRARAEGRFSDVQPTDGLSLDNLHGLGEARRFAQDLITDIHEAVEGRLDWEFVDRGVLLAGAPGTGKTTLAKAIAKDCGIRFISASAASWQSAGHLGDHIRAIRSDFDRARRYAPSILFIDEIDSVGNREDFLGQNAQYSTQVVNALLEQLQGMDPEAPVIVIAATNHPDRVDPALRRSGRLDRVIEIRRPNRRALAAIFRHYLAEYAGEDAAASIDTEALGAFAFGLTGADVERTVRGAVRRARRAGRPLQQSDLIDEMTRKPLDPESSPRLTEEEVRRVAVHEAGHAMASFLSPSRGEEISFVSIVPRADGTLGFVARTPPERLLITRTEYLDRLEVILGGRAAEEVVFGTEGISGGSQGDLKVATESAVQMTTRFGLGPNGSLLWTETATDAQREQASRILEDTYQTVLGKLRESDDELRLLADRLEDRQELTGDEVRAVMNGRSPERPVE